MQAINRYFVHACGCSETGRVREANEDAFVVADLSEEVRMEKNGVLRFPSGPRGSLFAVADGMGGAAAGEMASRLGIRTLYREVQEFARELQEPSTEELEQILIDAVGTANRRIFDLGQSDRNLAGMGTTLTGVLEVGGRLVVGQIGDSRAYLLREDRLRQLTRDQSLVAQEVINGTITEEEAQRHPQRNILLQALGVKKTVELALNGASVYPGDVILLCSDGLHAQISGGEIWEVIVESASPEAACRELVALANARGGPDNITAVLIQFTVK